MCLRTVCFWIDQTFPSLTPCLHISALLFPRALSYLIMFGRPKCYRAWIIHPRKWIWEEGSIQTDSSFPNFHWRVPVCVPWNIPTPRLLTLEIDSWIYLIYSIYWYYFHEGEQGIYLTLETPSLQDMKYEVRILLQIIVDKSLWKIIRLQGCCHTSPLWSYKVKNLNWSIV